MNFNDIRHIISNLGLEGLSPMQKAFIEQAPQAKEVLLLAPTGSGKTLAYMLGALLRPSTRRAIVICPSRELAQQSHDLLKRLTDEPSVCLTGGHAIATDCERIAAMGPKVVIATPGRLLDHLRSGTLAADNMDLLVIDEYDKCLDEGFSDELLDIRRRLPADLATWLISATAMPARIEDFIQPASATRLDFTDPGEADYRLKVITVHSPEKDKLDTLAHLLSAIGGKPAIVFVSHRESVDRVCAYLRGLGFAAGAYHGGLEQKIRERNLGRFRCGGTNVLVSTDLAARGIDIPDVEAVINYHLPTDEATFCHRNGRSTRWERNGTSYIIIGPTEERPSYVSPLTEELSVANVPVRPVMPPWATIYIGRGKKDKLSRGDVAGFLCKKGGLRGTDIGRIELGDHQVYAAIARLRLNALLKAVAGEKIKGIKTIIEEAR